MKTVSNEQLMRLLRPVVKENTFVLNLQNGIGTEEAIQQQFPQAEVFAGLCFLCCFRESPGVIRHHDYGLIRLAHYQKDKKSGFSVPLENLSTFLNSSALETETSPWHWQARWEKLVWNMCFNGLCTLFQKNTAELLKDEKGRDLAQSVLEEIVSAANTCGCSI